MVCRECRDFCVMLYLFLAALHRVVPCFGNYPYYFVSIIEWLAHAVRTLEAVVALLQSSRVEDGGDGIPRPSEKAGSTRKRFPRGTACVSCGAGMFAHISRACAAAAAAWDKYLFGYTRVF